MLLRVVLFVLMALGLSGFGTIAWISVHPPAPRAGARAQPVQTAYLVAAREAHGGTLLKPEDLAGKQFGMSDAPPQGLPDTPAQRSDLVGAMLRRSVQPGDAILADDVVRPGDRGFLAAVLGPGMRAATVGVDLVSGAAGLIWPGDHVDLILVMQNDDQNAKPGRRISGATVLQDVRVIAVDQQLVQGSEPGLHNQAQTRTVTLEVTLDQAERIAVASRLGHLQLAVRTADPQPGPQAEASRTIWGNDVAPSLNNNQPEAAAGSIVRVFRGGEEAKEVRF
jgi:pilus assembly protein CpaB